MLAEDELKKLSRAQASSSHTPETPERSSHMDLMLKKLSFTVTLKLLQL